MSDVLRLSLAGSLVLCLAPLARAYVDLAPTLGKVVRDAQTISLVEVQRFSRENGALILTKVRDLSGKSADALVRHQVAGAQTKAVPPQVLEWAEPGRRGVLFVSGSTAVVCVGRGWYQVNDAGDGWWKLGIDRPDLPLGYYGTVSRLSDAVELMVAGKTAIITTVPHGADEGASFDVALHRANLPGLVKVQRIRANLRMPPAVMRVSTNPAFLVGQGQAGEEEVPTLAEKLKSTDATVRAESADDLRTLGTRASAAAAPLVKLLDDPSPLARMSAAAALLHITPADVRAIDVLSKGLGSADATVRRHAAQAAGLAGPAAAPLTDALARLLTDPDELTRVVALQAVATLGPDAAGAMDAVEKLLDNPALMSDAADALGRMGPAARPAMKRLAKMLSAEPMALKWAAVRAMSQIGGEDASPAVEFMIGQLGYPSEVDGYNMMVYFGLLGPVAKDALPALENVQVKNRMLKLMAMWSIEPETGFPWMRGGGMVMREVDWQLFICEAFMHETGDRFRPAARVLARRIVDGTAGDMPLWGYKVLERFPDEAIGTLSSALTDKDIIKRERAVVALGYMGIAGAPARAQVVAALRSAPTEREQRLIKWCLREMGGE